MAHDCTFCKIGGGGIKAEVVDHDSEVFVLRDISPQAPVHLLIVPFEHVPSVADLDEKRAGLMSRLVLMANKAAMRAGVAERGYRLSINCGREGGQTVEHLHLHLLGGRQLSGQLG